ncbi:MAG TPA: Ppx/GppA phosphatase family protein [Desulfuromonadaceae bacterium]|jgi:exopolyphosphatase/guanosine-5'-triphosphate,3'-diphosphate pyrophosphatase
MKKTRLAAIDIGTNSIRCIVVEVDQQGRFVVLDDEKATVRLGENIGKTRAISELAVERAINSMVLMRKLLDSLQVTEIEAIATSAVRMASNGQELIKTLSSKLGHEIKIISGEEEAELAAISALNNFEMKGKRYAMLDIGGGSAEVVTALGSHIEEYYSVDLGAVLMTERFFNSDPVKPADYKKFQQHVRTVLKKTFSSERIAVQTFIGSGGTITSLGGMVMQMRGQSYSSVHGYQVLRSEVVHMLAMLMRKDLKARRAVPGLNPDRADIIVAGLGVVNEFMEFFGANMLMVNERGIREGLIIRARKRLGLMPETAARRTWRESVLDFAGSSHFDEAHCRHVSNLALTIFDGLAQEYRLKKIQRRLLEAAALLHDVGYFISYDSHHKHSYHLIRHADLFGFTPREREIIAQIARYHRKALPKKKHAEFQRLSEADQITVSRLGGILRLADGLDRRRSGLVEIVELKQSEDTISLKVFGTDDISVEIFGANAKKDLIEKAFKKNLVLMTC